MLRACIYLSIVLSLINFFFNRSLWLDEAALALNIVEKDIISLLRPLDFNQVAPIGFLLIEKIVSGLFGYSDWSLRVIPLVSYLISIYVFYLFSLKATKDQLIATVATAFYCSSYFVLYYSSEVKQYMTDSLLSLLTVFSVIRIVEDNSTKNSTFLLLMGVLGVWFSNVSIIVLFPAGLYYLHHTITVTRKYIQTFLILFAWSFSFAIYFFLFIHQHPTKEMMVEFWEFHGAFIHSNILSANFWIQLIDKFERYFSLLGFKKFSLAIIPFFIVGVLTTYRLGKNYLFLMIFPLLLHLALAYLKLYPFQTRLTLYMIPFLIILSVTGIVKTVQYLKLDSSKFFMPIILIPIVLNLVLLGLRGFPIENEEIKRSMRFIDENITKGDCVYVYDGSLLAFTFYKKKYSNLSEMRSDQIYHANSYKEDWNMHSRDVKELGNEDTIWLLFSHVYKKNINSEISEDEFIVSLFEMKGFEVRDMLESEGSSLYKMVNLIN